MIINGIVNNCIYCVISLYKNKINWKKNSI